MDLHLTTDERALLIRVLEGVLSDTRVELRRTTTPEFHDRLESEGRHLAGLLDRLRRDPIA